MQFCRIEAPKYICKSGKSARLFFKVVEASKNIETSIFSIFGVLENQKHRIFDVFLKKVKNKRFLRAPGAYHFS